MKKKLLKVAVMMFRIKTPGYGTVWKQKKPAFLQAGLKARLGVLQVNYKDLISATNFCRVSLASPNNIFVLGW
jgi:hypothetical protein